MTKFSAFRDIPQFTKTPGYAVNVSWDYIEEWIKNMDDRGELQICPDFQRGHVWIEAQQIAYVEFRLQGGQSGLDIYWNQCGWMKSFEGPLQLVDGLQRLTAVRRFLNNEIPAFGTVYANYEDRLNLLRHDFIFKINDLPCRADVLRWYLEMNTGGTPHTPEEISRVKNLLDAEWAKLN